MINSQLYFILGGIANSLFMLLHAGLAIRPEGYRFFGAGKLSDMHDRGSKFPRLVTLGLTLLFAVWAVYGFSAANLLPALPFMRTMILIIIFVYLLRGLMILNELVKVIFQGHAPRFLVFSGGALATGLMYLLGYLSLVSSIS
jgi:hypothetical protein